MTHSTRTHTWTCLACGEQCERPISRGQRPKWCPTCRARGLTERRCAHCGQTGVRSGSRYCSRACAAARRSRSPRQLKLALTPDQRSPLRRAVEQQDLSAVRTAVLNQVEVDPNECWIWQRKTNEGYAVVRIGNREASVHRLVMGEPDGVVHHTCSNRRCVNPGHLQVVTHAENVAEMLERRTYQERIAQLEAALAAVDPEHPLVQP